MKIGVRIIKPEYKTEPETQDIFRLIGPKEAKIIRELKEREKKDA